MLLLLSEVLKFQLLMKPASAVATPVEWERTMEADTLCPEAALVATVSTAPPLRSGNARAAFLSPLGNSFNYIHSSCLVGIKALRS